MVFDFPADGILGQDFLQQPLELFLGRTAEGIAGTDLTIQRTFRPAQEMALQPFPGIAEDLSDNIRPLY